MLELPGRLRPTRIAVIASRLYPHLDRNKKGRTKSSLSSCCISSRDGRSHPSSSSGDGSTAARLGGSLSIEGSAPPLPRQTEPMEKTGKIGVGALLGAALNFFVGLSVVAGSGRMASTVSNNYVLRHCDEELPDGEENKTWFMVCEMVLENETLHWLRMTRFRDGSYDVYDEAVNLLTFPTSTFFFFFSFDRIAPQRSTAHGSQ